MIIESNEYKEVIFMTTKENIEKLVDGELTVEEFFELIDLIEVADADADIDIFDVMVMEPNGGGDTDE